MMRLKSSSILIADLLSFLRILSLVGLAITAVTPLEGTLFALAFAWITEPLGRQATRRFGSLVRLRGVTLDRIADILLATVPLSAIVVGSAVEENWGIVAVWAVVSPLVIARSRCLDVLAHPDRRGRMPSSYATALLPVVLVGLTSPVLRIFMIGLCAALVIRLHQKWSP